MDTESTYGSPGDNAASDTSHTFQLPPGAVVRQIAFVPERISGQKLLLEFPPPIARQAVVVTSGPTQLDAAAGDLLVLSTSLQDGNDRPGGDCLQGLQQWVNATAQAGDPPSHFMTFQGAQVCWRPGRCAILAQPDRLEAISRALIEASFYEAELVKVEQALRDAWPQVEADTPMAFEFQRRWIGKRTQLRARFEQVIMYRGQLARISPFVHQPHLHPPTLASQIAERFRDRTRMMHRHESLTEQVEVLERIYEMCGERASDFMLTRSGTTLEWIIILLLLTQVFLQGFELLTSTG